MLDTEPLAARAWGDAAAALGVEFDMALALAMVGRNFADCSGDGPRALRRRLPRRRAARPLACRVRRDRRARGPRAEARRPRAARLARAHAIRARGRDVDTPRARAREARAHRRCCRAFATSSAATRSCAASPRPTSTWRPRAASASSARECIVLEDSEPGVRAALAAGMMPIMVPDLRAPTADLLALDLLVLPSLHEVLRAPCGVAARERGRCSRESRDPVASRARPARDDGNAHAIIARIARTPHDRPPHRNPRREEPAAAPARRAGRCVRGRRADEHVLQPARHRRARCAVHAPRRPRGRAPALRLRHRAGAPRVPATPEDQRRRCADRAVGAVRICPSPSSRRR